ncbi:ADAMTS-like protein 2 [Habropoda laboriosa]|uniref:ADAMTS-like protein 2 n=1 Tax=Habropoda laboriosa TaxID=597456 RepID=A0A0L7RBS9_9HYME|nr:ADAMTS-like protein 2 [Habropoda laboriosa]
MTGDSEFSRHLSRSEEEGELLEQHLLKLEIGELRSLTEFALVAQFYAVPPRDPKIPRNESIGEDSGLQDLRDWSGFREGCDGWDGMDSRWAFFRILLTLVGYLSMICLLGLGVSDNSTIGDSIIEDVSEVSETNNNLDTDSGDQSVTWGEWSPWSKWSTCSRSCGGGISRQQRRCRRKPCKGRPWSTKYKICNPEVSY